MNSYRLISLFAALFLLLFALDPSALDAKPVEQPEATALAQPAIYDPATFRAFVARRQVWQTASLDPALFPCVRLPNGETQPATASRCRPTDDITSAGDSVLFNALLCYSGERRGCAAVRASQGPDGRW